MPSKGQSFLASYSAWNTATNAYQTGDGGSHTISLYKDGTLSSATNTPTEISVNLPGIYALALTTAEATFNIVEIGGKSATSNVVLISKTYAMENLPVPGLATAGGLLTFGSGVGQLSSNAGGILDANAKQWLGTAPNALQSGLVQAAILSGAASGVVTRVTANADQIAGTATVSSLALGNVNLTTWLGTAPNILQNGLVQAAILSGAVTVTGTINANLTQINGVAATSSGAQLGVNVTQWRDLTPAPLTAALVQSAVSGNIAGNVAGSVGSVTGAVGSVTARVTANTDQIAGSTVNSLISGRVDVTLGQVQANAIGTPGFVAGALTTTVFASPYLTSALIDTTYSNAVADALLDRSNAIETGLTPRQALRLDAAAQGGKLSGAGTTSVNIWGAGVTTSRISATTDQSGNRLAVTLNL